MRDQAICFVGYSSHRKVRWGAKLVSPNLDSDVLAHADSPHEVYCLGEPVADGLVPALHVSLKPSLSELVWGAFRAGPIRFCDVAFLCRLFRHNEHVPIHGFGSKWLAIFWPLWAVRNLIVSRYYAYRFRNIAETFDQARIIVYYGAAMLGVVYAFRRLGKPVCEIQHGYIGPSHNAYNKERIALPRSFYAPSSFVVWDERTANFLQIMGAQDIEIVGYRHLTNFTTARGEIRKHVVLVTTQWLTPLPRVLTKLVTRFDHVTWRFRLHPLESDARTDIGAFLRQGNVELSRPENTLADDLAESVLHLTEHSSAVHEAAALGVFSVFCDPMGLERFAHEIASGLAQFVHPENALDVVGAKLNAEARITL